MSTGTSFGGNLPRRCSAHRRVFLITSGGPSGMRWSSSLHIMDSFLKLSPPDRRGDSSHKVSSAAGTATSITTQSWSSLCRQPSCRRTVWGMQGDKEHDFLPKLSSQESRKVQDLGVVPPHLLSCSHNWPVEFRYLCTHKEIFRRPRGRNSHPGTQCGAYLFLRLSHYFKRTAQGVSYFRQ